MNAVTTQAYTSWRDRALGVASFPFLVFDIGLGPYFSVIYLWDRYITVYCPRCGGVLTRKGVPAPNASWADRVRPV
jgi:hypothetical protein